MNTIIVDYDPFAMESRVYTLIDNKQESVNVCSEPNELAAMLVSLAHEHDAYEIKVRAPFATTCEFKRLITEYELKTYSKNNINVEGL